MANFLNYKKSCVVQKFFVNNPKQSFHENFCPTFFQVVLNGMEFQPNVASPNKKEAKANAALLCLQKLGIVTE